MGLIATYPKLRHDWLKHENDPLIHREEVTILAGAGDLGTGTVMAKITKGTATSAAKAGGNTGGGTCTMDATTPVLAGAKAGVYTARCVAADTNSGTFEIQSPDGLVMGSVVVGATWAEHVKFVISDSGTDFVVGDGFDITVAAGSGKWKKHVNGAVNGTEIAAGVLLDGIDASGETDVKGVIVTGEAEIAPLELTWDASVDNSTKKNAALAQLAELKIRTRRLV